MKILRIGKFINSTSCYSDRICPKYFSVFQLRLSKKISVCHRDLFFKSAADFIQMVLKLYMINTMI